MIRDRRIGDIESPRDFERRLRTELRARIREQVWAAAFAVELNDGSLFALRAANHAVEEFDRLTKDGGIEL